jgi:hypothetical protein
MTGLLAAVLGSLQPSETRCSSGLSIMGSNGFGHLGFTLLAYRAQT